MCVTFLSIIVACLTLLAYFGHFKDREFWRRIRRIKGKPWLPLIGNVHHLKAGSTEMFEECIKLWKEMGHTTFHIKIGLDVSVVISTPKDIEMIVRHTTLIDKPKEYSFLKSWIGDGLLISNGAKWRRQRKVITPTFHFKILEQYVDVFNLHSGTFIKVLQKEKSKVLDIYPLVSKCSLDIICDAAMGFKANAQADIESDYVSAVHGICAILMARMFSSYKRIQWIYDLTEDSRKEKKYRTTLHQLSSKVIKNRREEMKEEIAAAFASNSTDLSQHVDAEKKKHRPFLDLLLLSKLPNGEPLEDITIRDEVDTFIFEGNDTTASGMSFTLFLLSRHPDVQRRAFEEQLALLGPDLNRDPTYADLQEMKYLDRVIKESLRLYPSVPIIGRGITEDITLPDGTDVPAGVTMLLFVYGLQRHPKYYEGPDDFNPDRFLDDSLKDNNLFGYLPFSAGPRNCIGQKFAVLEMKSLISKVLRHYKLETSGPEHDLKLVGEITLKAAYGINVILEDRKYD